MAPVGFEPTIPKSERQQTYALDRATTGTGKKIPHAFLNQGILLGDDSTQLYSGCFTIIIISFMQGVYTYIPETNYVPREYSVAAILLLLFMMLISLVSVLNLLYFHISTLRSMCAVNQSRYRPEQAQRLAGS